MPPLIVAYAIAALLALLGAVFVICAIGKGGKPLWLVPGGFLIALATTIIHSRSS